MNFALLPPETNSGRLYDGPGSQSLSEAAATWHRLSQRLWTAAADYAKLAARLPAADAAAHAAACVEWLEATAASAEDAAHGAAASARAHDAALTATVPPPAIEANRTRRKSLAAANILGQASPAVADTDTDYDGMWVRNARAMAAYARASAAASVLTPFAPPATPACRAPAAPTWAVASAPHVVSTGRRVMSSIPDALRALGRSPSTTLDVPLASATPSLSRLSSLSAPSGIAISRLNALNKAAALRYLLPGNGQAPTIRVRLGRASLLGALSVPRVWSAVATPIPVRRGTVA
ncbi:PPE domain-containing protein [Mycobacterium sp. 050134]|uniref:PPE domain-containing protein n=1 Tax=Mycobacterium sp. 050134 TaxID=3096111 RepID=UPI002ED7A3DE